MQHFTVEQAIAAEFTLQPIKCWHCGYVGEVSYNQAVGDYYCAVCGRWYEEDKQKDGKGSCLWTGDWEPDLQQNLNSRI